MNIIMGITSAAFFLPWLLIILMPFLLTFITAYVCVSGFCRLVFRKKLSLSLGSLLEHSPQKKLHKLLSSKFFQETKYYKPAQGDEVSMI